MTRSTARADIVRGMIGAGAPGAPGHHLDLLHLRKRGEERRRGTGGTGSCDSSCVKTKEHRHELVSVSCPLSSAACTTV